MDTHQIISALLIALAGGILQGMVAFGFGLFSVPLLLSVGFSMPMVLAISAICTVIQSLSGVHHLRHVVPWKEVWLSVVLRGVTLLLGIWVVQVLVNYPVFSLKFWIGLVMLLMTLLQAAWQPKPRPKLHSGWNVAAFLVSGFTGGLCSMGGPPLVLWVMAHDWPVDRTRAFLFASFMSLVPLQLAILYWTFGHDVLSGMMLGIALSPAVLLGSVIGLRIGGRFSKPILRKVAFLVLLAIALYSMYPQILRWMPAH
jgi:uncharacterized membrane protein YfcA